MGPKDCKNVKNNEKRLGTSSVAGGLYQDLFIWYNSENSTCRGGSQEFLQVSPG